MPAVVGNLLVRWFQALQLIRVLAAVLVLSVGLASLSACDSATAPDTDPVPVRVEPVRPDVAAGGFVTCMVTNEGETLCWGYTDNRWLSASEREEPLRTLDRGYPYGADRSIPQPVDSAPLFARMAAGSASACGLTEDGQANCWGRNDVGNLGDGTLDDRWWAAPVWTELRFTRLAASSSSLHQCGLTTDGTAYCWGLNFRGQLGAGAAANIGSIHPAPVAVAGNHRFRMLAAGGSETCGLTTESELYCWGADFSGLTNVSRVDPTLIHTGVTLDTVVVGHAAVCGLLDERAYCRGWNGNGILGTGDTISQADFSPVETELRFRSISLGRVHACGLTAQGAAYCWGWGMFGRLGNGSEETRLVPTPVAGEHRFEKVAAGGEHTCAMKSSGEIHCWGYGRYGQLGAGSLDDSFVPVAVAMPDSLGS